MTTGCLAVWLKSHPDQAVEVRFDGEIHENWDHGFHYIQHTNYNSVMAIPSDMYVQGYDGKGVAKLRLWQAKASDFDMSSFSGQLQHRNEQERQR